MDLSNHDFKKDIEIIGQIPIVPALLDVVCRTTGMGFAAIARVTEDRWVTCSVLDHLKFGLIPGAELEIKTTICDEIRACGTAVIIDHVDADPHFREHHTPKIYGFQSYISVPILQRDGSFFGTLCALDPSPRLVSSPAVTGMFNLFADLISFHLNAIEQLEFSELRLLEERTMFRETEEMQKAFTEKLENEVRERTRELKQKNSALEKMNVELKAFAYVASHDLQEPLRKIQTFSSHILEKEYEQLSDKGKHWFNRLGVAAKRMQLLIMDLLAYSRSFTAEHKFEMTSLHKILEGAQQDLKEELERKNATIEVGQLGELNVVPFQFRQIFYHLLHNSLKFSNPGHPLRVHIHGEVAPGAHFAHEKINNDLLYCHISVSDNGIGFDQQYHERIFELFQRLYGEDSYAGTGLGLAIVKKNVEYHNGIVTATGYPDEGARFDIYIPVT